ncbi:MAG: Gfo/Idh/MocA family oxidoreductase [Bacteroidota bacterium]
MDILIYGFGRMGLSHYAILNKVIRNASFTIVDPNKKLNFFTKKNVNATILNGDEKLNGAFDYSLVCTPPMYHLPTIEKCLNRGDENIFVEKPFGGNPDDYSVINGQKQNCKIGYVLRYNPIINWVRENIDTSSVFKVEGSYYSNTIEEKPTGWRNGAYSGVLNEMGSHIIDLLVYLFNLEGPTLTERNIQSKISDVDDIVSFRMEESNREYHCSFNWVDKSYRKPVFNLKLHSNHGKYIIDQQKVELYKGNNLQMKKTAVDLAPKVPYYLRGVDFTQQMMDFTGNQEMNTTVQEGMVTRNLIREVLN